MIILYRTKLNIYNTTNWLLTRTFMGRHYWDGKTSLNNVTFLQGTLEESRESRKATHKHTQPHCTTVSGTLRRMESWSEAWSSSNGAGRTRWGRTTSRVRRPLHIYAASPILTSELLIVLHNPLKLMLKLCIPHLICTYTIINRRQMNLLS